jgi:hypothetical protein
MDGLIGVLIALVEESGIFIEEAAESGEVALADSGGSGITERGGVEDGDEVVANELRHLVEAAVFGHEKERIANDELELVGFELEQEAGGWEVVFADGEIESGAVVVLGAGERGIVMEEEFDSGEIVRDEGGEQRPDFVRGTGGPKDEGRTREVVGPVHGGAELIIGARRERSERKTRESAL